MSLAGRLYLRGRFAGDGPQVDVGNEKKMRRTLGMAAAIAGVITTTGLTMPVGQAAPSSAVSVVQGRTLATRIFPDNHFSVRDSSMATGRRVDFRQGIDYPACTSATYSICDGYAELNTLDGFDIQPRVTVPLTGPIDLASVRDDTVFITDDAGYPVSGLRQLTFDPATNTLAGISDHQLREATPYHVHVTGGLRDTAGHPVNACGSECDVRFTTRTASGLLTRIRAAMDLPVGDPRNAYSVAGFPGASTGTAGRKATFVQDGVADVFPAATVAPSVSGSLPGTPGIVRHDQQRTDPSAPGYRSDTVVPNLIPPGSAGYFAFGSFLSPRYQYASASGHQDNPYGTGDGRTDGEIPPVPTGQTAQPLGVDRLGVIAVTPDPVRFPPPWKVAVYGPGFTRSKFDIFVTADYNAGLGIATLATDPSGHGYGPDSTVTVTTLAGAATTFKSYGRGRDLDSDGVIGSGLNDGVGPTAHHSGSTVTPSRKPIDGLASGLAQTVVDNMALVRSIEAGMDIPGVGNDLFHGMPVMYYGLSFGGIYGTMLMGTDTHVHQGLLNVPGGPIIDIARLSSFRGNLQNTLGVSRPNFLNGGPGLNGFTEDMPLRNEPPVVISHAGAAQLQDLFGNANWFDRSGSPETFAPRIRLRPDPAWASNPKNVVFQTAYGDGTVPNPTAGTLYRAGDLFDRVVYYRNDKTPTYASDPHGWLADPTLAGRTSGEQQLGAFLSTGMLVPTDPAILETPIANPNNLECLHYADPETGMAANRQPFPQSGDCPPAPSHGTLPAGPVTTGRGHGSGGDGSDGGDRGTGSDGGNRGDGSDGGGRDAQRDSWGARPNRIYS